MNHRYKKINFFAAIALLVLLNSLTVYAEVLDRIIAIVEDEVILESELNEEVHNIVRNLQANKVMIPPPFVLRKQVLERMVIDKLQKQFALRSGIRVSDAMLQGSMTDIARRNNLSLAQFRAELEKQGMNFKDFQNNIRNEIIINQLRAREVSSRIKVTDREISHYLETQGEIGKNNVQYHLGHILIPIAEGASSSTIQKAKEIASKVVTDLQEGADFEHTALSVSAGSQALKGGDLGWRTIGEIPTLFVDYVSKMKEGDVADLIRSPSGFHIIKMLGLKGVDKYMVTKTKARHILIKTNELINDAEAKKRLQGLKERILDGDDFATLARSNSDDKGSAINGGDLGWVGPGDLVPAFESVMNHLPINGISDPVQTQFGWHLIQVLERKEKDNSVEFKKNQVKDLIRARKIEEETELWMRRLRDEAYVDIYQDRL